ncbi:S1C family serine protease [Chloroflexota bacterium]
MKYKHRRILLLGMLLPILALACSLGLPTSQVSEPQASPVPPTAVPSNVKNTPITVSMPSVVTEEEATLIDLYARVNPSVVNIVTFTYQGGADVPTGQGSGFVFDAEGHIVTNAHVVHGADELDVIFSDETMRASEVVGEDLNSDLAVIKVESLPAGVIPLILGDIDEVAVGQTVIAIGNPFGLGGTLTGGIVSALGRTIPALTPRSIPQSIQTDAAINPGNSGGPLLNMSGEVIGVNAQIETGNTSRSNSGVGFAIPVSILERVIPELIKDGEYEWAWLGVRGGGVTPALAKAMNLPVEHGAYIASVEDNGPADKANIRGANDVSSYEGRQVEVGGDVIIAIDGVPIRSFGDLLIFISLQTTPGQEVTLTIIRDGETKDLVLKMGERPTALDTSQDSLPFPSP